MRCGASGRRLLSDPEWLWRHSPETTWGWWCHCRCLAFSLKAGAGSGSFMFSALSDVCGRCFGWCSWASRRARIVTSVMSNVATSSRRWWDNRRTKKCRFHGRRFGRRRLFGRSSQLSFLKDGDFLRKLSKFHFNQLIIAKCHFSLQTQLPQFLKDVLDFDIKKSAIISAIPYISMSFMLQVAGYLSDWVRIKGYWTTGQTRRYFNCLAFIAQTICMLLTAFFLHPAAAVTFITIGVALASFAYSSFSVNYLGMKWNRKRWREMLTICIFRHRAAVCWSFDG